MIVGDVESARPGSPDGVVETGSGSMSGVRLDQRYTLAGTGAYGASPGPATKTTVVPSADTSTSAPVTIAGVASGTGASDTGANASESSWTPSTGSST